MSTDLLIYLSTDLPIYYSTDTRSDTHRDENELINQQIEMSNESTKLTTR